MKLSGWGNYPVTDGNEFTPTSAEEVAQVIRALPSCIPRGNARSYGDASIQMNTISSLRMDKFIKFDAENAFIECQSGVLLDDILKFVVPKGFFLPVLPGTKYVTVGGAIAADVHGKNHQKNGSISGHVEGLTIITDTGKTINCSPKDHSDLFWTTFGAMGLTGFVYSARLSLRPIESAYFCQENIKASNIAETIQLFEESSEFEYRIAWLDSGQEGMDMGRSIFSRGRHASLEDLPDKKKEQPFTTRSTISLSTPSFLPSAMINSKSLKVFNTLYYKKQRSKLKASVVPYEQFLFPLDRLKNWSSLYGANGFIQYQIVIPGEYAAIALGEVFSKVQLSGATCSLATMRKFGDGNEKSPMSFPMPGYCIALDFKRTDASMALCDLLDDIVINYSGRAYLAKDARMLPMTFTRFYPKVSKLISVSKKYNKNSKFRSLLSDRLNITS